MMMKSAQIRQSFLNYFSQKQQHTVVPSSSLVPQQDATLLFANAGMNQFKNVFLGLEERPYRRATSSQKCVRAGGKHNDLENVGFTARHHTFFEMLGNFSFGDYFKKDAIAMAWELLTRELQIPADRLFVTVYKDDDEAADIWHRSIGIPNDRIYRFGEKDNFWRMGDTGPCGPCTEIYYDHGPEAEPENAPPSVLGGDGDRYVEIWNLVFMQFNENESGERTNLPKPCVDTGAGLERWAAMLQGQHNNYDTDLFIPIINSVASLAQVEYFKSGGSERDRRKLKEQERKVQTALRVIADHSRSAAFLIADGVLPSNEGRGYVLRRILRRAIRYGRELSERTDLIRTGVNSVINQMKDFYPELSQHQATIERSVQDETDRFLQTLDQGSEILKRHFDLLSKDKAANKISNQSDKVLPGNQVFQLYDTYGFPIDLTRLMAKENGFDIDEEGFEKCMREAKERARSSWKGQAISSDAAHLVQLAQTIAIPTEFTGYPCATYGEGKILALSNGHNQVEKLTAGQSGILVFDKTCFYAESGGQTADHGQIFFANKPAATATPPSAIEAEVVDVQKQGQVFIHHVHVTKGELKIGATLQQAVSDRMRRAIAANHSATHLLHAALRKTLGTHVTQAGSHVDAGRLRFDYTHNKALTRQEIENLEAMVNEEIAQTLAVNTENLPYDLAVKSGAMALFGENYGSEVRVVRMGQFSSELCGGTHVTNTAFIRAFKIVSESGVSSGVRRIEALTGERALQLLLQATRETMEARQTAGIQTSWSSYLDNEVGTIQSLQDWIQNKNSQQRQLEREIHQLKGGQINVDALLNQARSLASSSTKTGASGGISSATSPQFLAAHVDLNDRKLLSDLSDRLQSKMQAGGVVLLAGNKDTASSSTSFPILISISKNLVPPLHAGKTLQEVSAILGGKGGGRPDFAQGAGENSHSDVLKEAFEKAFALIEKQFVANE